MGYWLKSYTDILDDPKYHRMSERGQLAMHEIFLIAKMIEADELTGLLPCIEDIAFYSRKPIDYWEEAMPELLKSGIVIEKGNEFIIVNYVKRQQAISDDERSKQYRKRKNDQRMSDDTNLLQDNHDSETLRDGDKIREDKIREDKSTELSTKNPAETDPSYEDCTPDGEPVVEKKKKKTKDERSMSPAIISFRRLTGLYPPKVNYEQVISVLGEQPDEAKMKRCYQDWCGRGFKPTNINWLLDWYVNGVPVRGKPQYGKPIGLDAVNAELARLEQEKNNG
jgi:hypothetical protein